MILGFKQQFEMPIKKGTKIHTIRQDKPNRWKSGMLIHFAKGVRTKNYINFQLGQCFSTQKIKIKYNPGGGVNVWIDDQWFHYQTDWGLSWDKESEERILQLAKNDGFDSIGDFFNWFNQDFEGKIIHWTDFRY